MCQLFLFLALLIRFVWPGCQEWKQKTRWDIFHCPLECARLLKFPSAQLSFCTSSAQDFYPLKVWNFFQSDRAQRRYSLRPRRRGIYFDAFRPSVHTKTQRVLIENTPIWKHVLKVGRNENAYVSYSCGRSKTHQWPKISQARVFLAFS